MARVPRGLPARRAGSPLRLEGRTLADAPPTRRDLIDRRRYLCPNSIVVSRGCPHHCDFCYKDAFYEGGVSFYTQAVDRALAEIDRLPGKHVYFLDDHLLGNPRFAAALFEGMRGMGRVFQGASTVDAILRSDLIERAAEAGHAQRLRRPRDGQPGEPARCTPSARTSHATTARSIRKVHGLGIMINASFVFGLDDDGPDVFDRTVEWGVSQSIETATFHIMTPYPGTALHAPGRRGGPDHRRRLGALRHPPRRLPAASDDARAAADRLSAGVPRLLSLGGDRPRCRWASRRCLQSMRHLAYAGGWKKFEPFWDLVIRAKRVNAMLPLLEGTLDAYGRARRRTRDRSAVIEDERPATDVSAST